MSARQEELITEEEALRYLQITPERLKSIASQGLLTTINVEGPGGEMIFYYRGQIESLKEKLRWQSPDPEKDRESGTLIIDEWPDVIE